MPDPRNFDERNRAERKEELAHYRNADDTPRLRNAVVLFLDQLGTKELVEKEPEAHLLRTFEAARIAHEFSDLSESWQVARWFSDNLLLAARVNDTPMDYRHDGPMMLDRAFGLLIINAARLQLAFILGGIVTRGGIDLGEFYADQDFMYGPALNRAYLLESKEAHEPRIVLGDAAVERVITESDNGDMGTYEAMLVKDEDGHLFVNYFGDLPFTYEEIDETIIPLERHRALVEASLVEHASDEKLLAKYQWMAAFHNWIVAGLPEEMAEPLLLNDAPARQFTRLDYAVLGLETPTPW